MTQRWSGRRYKPLLLTAAAALLTGVFLSAAPAQARYIREVSWQGVYAAAAPQAVSNCLAAGGQSVLLEDWRPDSPEQKILPIEITADGVLSGPITCESSQPRYLEARLSLQSLEMTAGESRTVELILLPTDAARQLTQPTTATVRVAWRTNAGGMEMSADFFVNLLPLDWKEEKEEVTMAAETLIVEHTGHAAPRTLLGLLLSPPSGGEAITLQWNGGGFPAFTRYSIDGENCTVLAEGGEIRLPSAAINSLTVLLDFSWAAVSWEKGFAELRAIAWSGGQAVEGQAVSIALHPAQSPLEIVPDDDPPVLTGQGELHLRVTGEPDSLQLTLERLTEEGYRSVSSAEAGLTLTYSREPTGRLCIANASGSAPAGSYRLTAARMFAGIPLAEDTVVFFIHYH